MHIVIVIPTYNERDTISEIISRIFFLEMNLEEDDFSVLVVDDSSPDGTADVVRDLQKKYKSISLLTGQKEGLGAAYQRGFRHALEEMSADAIVQMDADLSHNPNDIPRLIHELKQGYDLVIGSRYTEGGSVPPDWPYYRKINSKAANLLARTIGKTSKISDSTGGFRVMRRELFDKIPFSDIKTKGYVFQVTFLHFALENKATISEIPISFSDREKFVRNLF